MSRALNKALLELQKYVASTKSRIAKIVQGQGDAGTRAAPAQTEKNDANIGLRLDFGDRFTKDGKVYRRYKLQVNKHATDSALKALAAKDSHKVWAEADVQISPASGNAEKTAADFFKNLEMDLNSKAK